MRPDPYSGLDAEEKQLLLDRAARYARVEQETTGETIEVVSFARGNEQYAIPLSSLREIRTLRKACFIPGAARSVPAIFHHRGEILSAHDLSAFLHGAPAATKPEFAMIVDEGARRIALMADELIGVVQIVQSQLIPLPATLGDRASGFGGVGPDGLLVLRPAALFDTPAISQAF